MNLNIRYEFFFFSSFKRDTHSDFDSGLTIGSKTNQEENLLLLQLDKKIVSAYSDYIQNDLQFG